MGIIKSLINIVIPVVDMTKPQPERQEMSPKQLYDYLISSRRLTPEEQAMLEYLHKALRKDRWDSP